MVDRSRRNFFTAKKLAAKPAIRLPWVISENIFTDNCTQCSECISACPESIIAKGDGGFPEIRFEQGECTFCQKCVQSCSEPLFIEDLTQPAWHLAIEIKPNCLAINHIYCQSCQDSCEFEAIQFKYLSSSVPQPKISIADCNGCGACVSVCPQSAIELSTPNSASVLSVTSPVIEGN